VSDTVEDREAWGLVVASTTEGSWTIKTLPNLPVAKQARPSVSSLLVYVSDDKNNISLVHVSIIIRGRVRVEPQPDGWDSAL